MNSRLRSKASWFRHCGSRNPAKHNCMRACCRRFFGCCSCSELSFGTNETTCIAIFLVWNRSKEQQTRSPNYLWFQIIFIVLTFFKCRQKPQAQCWLCESISEKLFGPLEDPIITPHWQRPWTAPAWAEDKPLWTFRGNIFCSCASFEFFLNVLFHTKMFVIACRKENWACYTDSVGMMRHAYKKGLYTGSKLKTGQIFFSAIKFCLFLFVCQVKTTGND